MNNAPENFTDLTPHSMPLSHKTINWLLFIACIAGSTGALADVLLLYNPLGGYEDQTYQFLQPISNTRLIWGHYLGVLFIPLQLLGLFHIYRGLAPAGIKWVFPLLIITVFTVFPGVAYHATCAFTAVFIKINASQTSAYLPFIKSLFEPLGLLLAMGMVSLSLLFGHIVFWKATHFKKWMAFCMPLSFYVVFLLLYLLLPTVGNVLVPAGFNLSFLLFFICSWLAFIDKPIAE